MHYEIPYQCYYTNINIGQFNLTTKAANNLSYMNNPAIANDNFWLYALNFQTKFFPTGGSDIVWGKTDIVRA